mgnify:CR=1 FL=1
MRIALAGNPNSGKTSMYNMLTGRSEKVGNWAGVALQFATGYVVAYLVYQIGTLITAGTVGTGNIAGVAGAIAIGGPGAVFWMWVSALLGMMTKLAEAVLAVRYRVSRDGECLGGPMQVIRLGMGERWRWLAWLYSFLPVLTGEEFDLRQALPPLL